MRTTLTALIVFAAVIFAVAEMRRSAPPTPQEISEDQYEQVYADLIAQVTEQAQYYVTLFNENRLEELHENFSDQMKQLTSLEDLELMRDARVRQLGVESEVVSDSMRLSGPNFIYERISIFDKYKGQVQIQITMNGATQIVGLIIQPHLKQNGE